MCLPHACRLSKFIKSPIRELFGHGPASVITPKSSLMKGRSGNNFLNALKKSRWNPRPFSFSYFLKMTGGTWQPLKFMKIEKLPFIPTDEEITQLITGCNQRLAAFLQLLKETGMRSGEAWNLKWADFDFERKQVRVTPEKGSRPILLPITSNLVAMLKMLSAKNAGTKTFEGSLRHFARLLRFLTQFCLFSLWLQARRPCRDILIVYPSKFSLVPDRLSDNGHQRPTQ